MAPVVACLDPRGRMQAVKVVRLLQAVLPIQDDVHDPLLTRLDPGKDDIFRSSVSPLLHDAPPDSMCTRMSAWAPMIAMGWSTCADIWPDLRLPMIVYKNCPTVDLPCASSKPGETATGAAKPRGAGAGQVGPRPRRGTTHIVFTPHELIEKLIPLIPRPRCHLVRYHGILGPAAKDRAKVVPTPPTLLAPSAPDAASHEPPNTDKAGIGEPRDIDITAIQRGSRLPWAVLLKRVFMTDALTCPKCQGRLS